jgi:hypothetical protein
MVMVSLEPFTNATHCQILAASPPRHCERSEAIQRARSAQTKRSATPAANSCLARLPARSWIASLRSQ